MAPNSSLKGRPTGAQTEGKGCKCWDFVNISVLKETTDAEVRRKVRVNAANAHWRRRVKHDTEHHTKSTITCEGHDTATAETSALKMKKGTPNTKNDMRDELLLYSGYISDVESQHTGKAGYEDRYSSSPLQASSIPSPVILGAGMIDPFNTFPIGYAVQYNNSLLSHFASVIQRVDDLPLAQRKHESYLTKTWLPYTLHDDSMLFLCTLTCVTAHLDTLDPHHKSPKTLWYKSEIIRAVNANLRCPENAASDSTIGAVVMLAATENIDGNCEGFRIHINALREMVSMRGGLQKLGFVAQLHVLWQEFQYSSLVDELPHHELSPNSTSFSDSFDYHIETGPSFNLSDGLDGRLGMVFRDLRYFTFLNTNPANPHKGMDLLHLGKIRSGIEHRLLALRPRKHASESTYLDHQLNICRLAAMIYIQHSFLVIPSNALTCRMKAQTMAAFRAMEERQASAMGRPQSIMLLWALLIGGITSVDADEENWFAQRIARCTRAIGIFMWEHTVDQLNQICWMDRLYTPTCKSLWNRVEGINVEYWLNTR